MQQLKWDVLVTQSCLNLCDPKDCSLPGSSIHVTPWTIAGHVPLSTGFARQEHWSELPCPSPGYFPNPGIEARSPAL